MLEAESKKLMRIMWIASKMLVCRRKASKKLVCRRKASKKVVCRRKANKKVVCRRKASKKVVCMRKVGRRLVSPQTRLLVGVDVSSPRRKRRSRVRAACQGGRTRNRNAG